MITLFKRIGKRNNALNHSSLQQSNAKKKHSRFCTTTIIYNETEVPVAYICFEESNVAGLFLIKGILGFISVIFILFTLYIYKIIPSLRDTQVRREERARINRNVTYPLQNFIQLTRQGTISSQLKFNN